MSKISKVLAALVLTLGVGASANGFEQQVEGVTAAGLFSPVKVSPSMSWKEIGRKSLPNWPTIALPDGVEHRVDGLCSDGTYLRSIYAKTAERCGNYGEGVCHERETVELKTPINYSHKICSEWKVERVERSVDGGQDWVIRTCAAYRTVNGTHPLGYNVEVRTAPQRMNGDSVDIDSGEILFVKPFAIPSCN